MTMDNSDFESKHNERFHIAGKSNFPEIKKGKKNILLIGPQSDLISAERSFMAPALGVIRLAGYLNQYGHYSETYEPNINMLTNEGPYLEDVLKSKPWDIIGFSILEETLTQDIKNIYLSQKIRPKALLIAGGIEAQFNYQTILDKTPCKIVFISEAEKGLLALANDKLIQEIPGIVYKNSSVPLDQETFNIATSAIQWEDLPYERYWDYYLSKYGEQATEERKIEIHTVRVFSRNRCPIGCKFCSSTNQITWGSGLKVPVISATEDTLIHNIKRIVEAHPRVRTIYLTDDDFCINKKSVIRFCEKILSQNFKNLTFMAFCRASDATEEMFHWMKKAGFRRLNIGIESFSNKVLKEMNKLCTTEENHHCLSIAKKIGIGVYCNIIATTPESTLEDIEATIDNAIKYASDPFYHVGVVLAIKPLKGTEYYETFTDFKSRISKIEGTNYNLRFDDFIYANDSKVKKLQLRYWNEVDDYMNEEIKKKDIRHGNARNVSLLKLNFFKKLIIDIKNENSIKDIDLKKIAKTKAEPFYERQTVDIETKAPLNSKKRSRFGAWIG
jgi:radical SAM superfamily enzyme YgiQ (UPF0313 family)